jgi:NifU-like protein involved in Fe-S cluster formation
LVFPAIMPYMVGIMSASLYNSDILRLAASIPYHERLADPQASVEKRSAVCGSRVAVDVNVDAGGRLIALGLEVRACALGQASACLLAEHAMGRSIANLAEARDKLAAYLDGTSDDLSFWPGMTVFAPARGYPARHASIRLGFEALAEAVEQAAR